MKLWVNYELVFLNRVPKGLTELQVLEDKA